jgi:hypothetical protein
VRSAGEGKLEVTATAMHLQKEFGSASYTNAVRYWKSRVPFGAGVLKSLFKKQAEHFMVGGRTSGIWHTQLGPVYINKSDLVPLLFDIQTMIGPKEG